MTNTKCSRLLTGFLGMILICMLGACTVEKEGESDDESLQLVEAISEQKEAFIEESEINSIQTLDIEEMSTPETSVEAAIEPTNTTEVTTESTEKPSSTPEVTAELTEELAPTHEVTPEPTAEPSITQKVTQEPTEESTPIPEVMQEPAPKPAIKEDAEQESATTQTDYVLNKNTMKFHYAGCSSVKQMKDKNKKYYTGTREECINMGYDPCGRCNP